MSFLKCSRVQSTIKADDLIIPIKGECKLEISESVGTLFIKIHKIKYPFTKKDQIDALANTFEVDEKIIIHKVSFYPILTFQFISILKIQIYERNSVFKDEDMSVTINLYNGSLELKLVVKDDYNDFKENYNKISEKIQVKFTRNKYTKRDAFLK